MYHRIIYFLDFSDYHELSCGFVLVTTSIEAQTGSRVGQPVILLLIIEIQHTVWTT